MLVLKFADKARFWCKKVNLVHLSGNKRVRTGPI